MLLFSQEFAGVCLRIAAVVMLAVIVAVPFLLTRAP